MLPMEADDDDSCRWWQVDCRMGDFGSTLVGDAVENLAAAVLEAVGNVVGTMASLWVYVGTVNLTDPDGIEGGIDDSDPAEPGQHHTLAGQDVPELLNWATWISLGICVLALVALGATMAIKQRRGEGAEHANKLGIILFATALISAAAALVTGVLPSTGPEDSARPVMFLQTHLWWYMGAVAVVSVLAGAVRMVWEQRADPGKDLVKSLLTLAVVSGAGVSIIGAAVAAADGFAQWIINEATDLEFGDAIVEMLAVGGGAGAFVAIFLGIFVLFFSFIQIILMIIRAGMLVILAGIFPLAASFTNTEMGKAWFRKCIAWLIAFILYKPAAAIVYAAAFQLIGSSVFHSAVDPDGILNMVVGVTMLLISLIAMPALMKFVAPMASMGAGGVGGAMAGVAGAVGGQMASGAMKIGSDSAQGATSGGGGGGGDEPSGSAEGSDPSGSGASPEGSGGPSGGGEGQSEGGGETPDGSAGAEAAGGGGAPGGGAEGAAGGGEAASGAAAGAGGGHPAMMAAQKAQEVGQGFKDDAQGAVDSSTKGPDD